MKRERTLNIVLVHINSVSGRADLPASEECDVIYLNSLSQL